MVPFYLFTLLSVVTTEDRHCQCQPGMRVLTHCKGPTAVTCQKCPEGEYRGEWRNATACLPCPGQDIMYQVEDHPCHPDRDNKDMCLCKNGTHLHKLSDSYCRETKDYPCPKDHKLLNPGDRRNRPNCTRCEPGTHTDGPSFNTSCTPDTPTSNNPATYGINRATNGNNVTTNGKNAKLAPAGNDYITTPGSLLLNSSYPDLSMEGSRERNPLHGFPGNDYISTPGSLLVNSSYPNLSIEGSRERNPLHGFPEALWAILAACVILLPFTVTSCICVSLMRRKKRLAKSCNGGRQEVEAAADERQPFVEPCRSPCADSLDALSPAADPNAPPVNIGVIWEDSHIGEVHANNIADNWAFQKGISYIIAQTARILDSDKDGVKIKRRIAVLDSGIEQNHPVFEGFTFTFINCVEYEQDIAPSRDPQGHGTSVTGIMCEMVKDLKQLLEIVVIKVVDQRGEVKFENIKKAYVLLLSDNMADVEIICQPNGFPYRPPPQTELMEVLKNITARKVLICAASNEGCWTADCIAWPARDSIAIGSHDKNAVRLSSSPQGQDLHMLAPGSNILTANARYNPQVSGSARLRHVIGTSYATPWTVGILLHLLFQIPYRCPDLLENRRRELGTTDHAKSLLRNLAGESFTKERGYGHLMPWQKAFENDWKFKLLIQETFKMHGVNNVLPDR